MLRLRINLKTANMPVQSMEIGATTELGQHVLNSAEQVARLEEEPATILLLLLEGKTVKESLWNLGVVILNHVQVRFCCFDLSVFLVSPNL